jgi:hypothetical protein
MGGGLSGGSAAHASGTEEVPIDFEEEVIARGRVMAEIAPSAATHALRQEAALSIPSGQQGHGSPSAMAGMES